MNHVPFAVLNRTANPIVRLILRSRSHRLLSGHLLLLTVTGRRTGRKHTFPVGYSEADGLLTIHVAAPESKRWWHNVGSETPVQVTLRGVDRSGFASVHGDERRGVSVEIQPGAVRPPLLGRRDRENRALGDVKKPVSDASDE